MKYLSKHKITGRGTVLVMELENDEQIQVGDRIPHEGMLLQVIGVERSRKLMSPPIESKIVGLVVSGNDDLGETTAIEALFQIEECEIGKPGLLVRLQHIILDDLVKLQTIAGYINQTDIIPELKVAIIKSVLEGKSNAKPTE